MQVEIVISGMPSPPLKTYYAKDRKTWRAWLEKNHVTSPGVWLIYFKRSSGKPRVEYKDAVEEALCFGWIDSTIKRVDEESFMQRFTPRKPKSGWSGLNKQRIKKLMKEGLMSSAGLKAIDLAKKNGSWKSLDKIYAPVDKLELPNDLQKALEKNKKATSNFESFPIFARRQILYWINSAKQDATRKARVRRSVSMIALNKKPSMEGFKK